MNTITGLLREQRFFAGLNEEWLHLIAECGREINIKEGDFIFREGESADCFYLVLSGTVSIETAVPGQTPAIIQTVTAGELMGWSWLFPPYQWLYDARVIEAVHCIVFDGRLLRGKCEENAEMGYEFMKRFSAIFINRLKATRLQVLDMYRGEMA